jgi:hypothetical protein
MACSIIILSAPLFQMLLFIDLVYEMRTAAHPFKNSVGKKGAGRRVRREMIRRIVPFIFYD